MNSLDSKTTSSEPNATTSLLSAGELSVDRMPMLQALFEGVCEKMIEQFSQLSSAQLEIALERVWTGAFHDVDVNDDRHIVVQLDIDGRSTNAYFVLDRPSLYLLLECMLGASGNERPYLEQHEFTATEFLFAKTIANQASQAFCRVFSEFFDMSMSIRAAVKGTDIDSFDIDDGTFLTANIALEVFDRSGTMNILIPHAIMAPFKKQFISAKKQEAHISTDQPWIEHIKSQLQHTDMECQASLDGGTITLGEVSQLKVGQILELGIPADSAVRLSSNDEDLFWCQLGQTDGAFTLKIKEPASEKKDFLDVMLENRSPDILKSN